MENRVLSSHSEGHLAGLEFSLLDMDWTLIRDNDDHMVPEPQDASHMAWINGGDPAQITWIGCMDPVIGWDGAKKQTAVDMLCQTRLLKEGGLSCKETVGRKTEDFSSVYQSSEFEFQFKPSSMNARDFYSGDTTHRTCTRTEEAGLSNNILAVDASLCMDHSVYEDESTSELSAACPFLLMNTRSEGVDGLFEDKHLIDKADDLLEHSWENIDDLSSLEDMDNMFLDPLFQADKSDTDNVSQAPSFLSGLQCSSPVNMLQVEIPLSHGSVEFSRTSKEMSCQSCPQHLKKKLITSDSTGSNNSSKDIKAEDNCYTQPSYVTSSHPERTGNSAAVKATEVVQSRSVSIEDKAYPYSKVYNPSISQGPLMTSAVSGKAYGVYDEKLMAEEEGSMEAVALHELKVTMLRLDPRTRICIRDALYRLGRSARQRHAASEGGSAKIETQESSNSVASSESPFFTQHSCKEAINLVETETNAIDRTIASLLFHNQCIQSSTGLGNLCMPPSFDGKFPSYSMALGPPHQWDCQLASSNSSMMFSLTSVGTAHQTFDVGNKVPRLYGRTNIVPPEWKCERKAETCTNHIRTSEAGYSCIANSQKLALVPNPLLQRRDLHYGLGMGAPVLGPAANQLIGISADPKGCVLSNPITQRSVQIGIKSQRKRSSV